MVLGIDPVLKPAANDLFRSGAGFDGQRVVAVGLRTDFFQAFRGNGRRRLALRQRLRLGMQGFRHTLLFIRSRPVLPGRFQVGFGEREFGGGFPEALIELFQPVGCGFELFELVGS
ncbi:MAG: hypothetical protein BWY66_00722 [bacterium ADurb.Bin374]|nr:MAG: hypothetical protein BWY66_00722 [bacterium ADurb.Bin374]